MHDCASNLVSKSKRTFCSYAFCIVNPYINIEIFFLLVPQFFYGLRVRVAAMRAHTRAPI